MAAGSHFAFLTISDQYAALKKKIIKWPPAAILDDQKSLLIGFSPFQINTQLFFKMAASGQFGFRFFAKIDRDLPL